MQIPGETKRSRRMIKVVIILLLIIIAALLIVGVVDGNRFVVAKQQFVLPNLRKNWTARTTKVLMPKKCIYI